MSTDLRRDSWSRYWAAGALHSCASSFAGNYEDEIGAFWRQEFADWRADARALDVATGNGALPKLIIDTLAAWPEIDAVDLADIAPRWPRSLPKAQRARLRFHPRVLAEQLPFADASFDYAISQYGLEYSDLARSLPELRRVLRSGARVALVVHHRESLPVAIGSAEVAHIDGLLAPGQLLDLARALIPILVRLATPAGLAAVQRDPNAAALRQQYNLAMRALQERAQAAAAPDVLLETQQAVGDLIQRSARLGLREAVQRLDQIVRGLQESRLRQAELVRHALTREAVEAIAAALGARQLTLQPLHARGAVFAWGLRVQLA
ncbi:MAG: class I SAM-dependent methyltransferase [Lysobacterales bacterium]